MEINNNLKRKIKKNIIKFVLFCLAIKYYVFYFFAVIITFLFMPFAYLGQFIQDKLPEHIIYKYESMCAVGLNTEVTSDGWTDACFDYFLIIMIIVVSCTTFYLLAKIFDIFKILDKINFFLATIILLGLSQILVWLGTIEFLMEKGIYEAGIEYSWSMYTLVPAFFTYKFFAFLTKKYPVPFEKIGYYFSIEFYKKLWIKFKKKISKNN